MESLVGNSPPLPIFDVDADKSTVGVRWTKWIYRFENYLKAANITNPERMKAQVLHFAGEAVYDIATSLDLTPRVRDRESGSPAENVYDALKRVLTEHFHPKANKEYNRYLFRQAKQGTEENLDHFYARLKKLTLGCEFTEEEAEIKSHLICSCRLLRLRRAALENPTMTLSEMLEKGRTFELAHLQLTKIDERQDNRQLNNIGQKKGGPNKGQYQNKNRNFQKNRGESRGPPKKDCPFCGNKFHEDGLSSCPARGRTCHNCNKPDHFSSVCLRKKFQNQQRSMSTPPPSTSPAREGTKVSFPNSASSFANNLQQQPAMTDDGEEDSYCFAVQSTQPAPRVKLELGDNIVTFLLDTGSDSTIIDQQTYNQIGRPRLFPTNRKIYAFNARQPVPLWGAFKQVMKLPNTDHQVVEEIYVTKSNLTERILSFPAAQQLKCLTFSPQVQVRQLSSPNQIGKLIGVKIQLHIDPNVRPVALPHRRIPYNLRGEVEQEIKKLEDLDIIEKVTGPTPWVSPVVIVPKPNGKIRLCVDMRQPNKAILRERHITPTLEDILAEIVGSKFFSTLDLNQAYHQLELAEESRYITTFSTHVGLRRYKRLFFGVSSASEIFHNVIRETLSDIEGAINACDDILVHGRTQQIHDRRLAQVKQRLAEKNLTIQEDKMQISKQKVKFWGVIITDRGIEIDPEKMQKITACTRPSSVAETKSFLGMINYCSRFIKGQADLTEPLRRLSILPDSAFVWTEECVRAFNTLKQRLRDTRQLYFYDPKKKTELVVDASPIGLGAILRQLEPSGASSIIAFASKALTPTERRYSQTEREALSIIWGCEQFRLYLLGIPVTVWTDHKPLVPLFNNPNATLSARMERWMLRKQPFNITVQYLPGEWNAADFLSRHPDLTQQPEPSDPTKVAERYVQFLSSAAAPRLIPPEEIINETKQDFDLQLIIETVMNGRWNRLDPRLRSAYHHVASELTVTEDGVLLRGQRICLPTSLQLRAIKLAHEGHQGIVRTKQLLRTKVWFPGIDKAVEEYVSSCVPCQVSTPKIKRTPLLMSPMPEGPWKELSLDFYTLPTEDEILVLTDDFSRFPVVEEVKSTGFKHVSERLNHYISIFGIPNVIRTDNGPPFNGEDFKQFSKHLGFVHRKITPAWPPANGEAERFMRTIGKLVRTATASSRPWRPELQVFLRNYRTTPHPSTGQIPAEIFFNRRLRNRLPDLELLDGVYKKKIKDAADRRLRTVEHNLKLGDKVFRKKEARLLNKMQPLYELEPYVIIGLKGNMVTAQNSHQVVTRNSSFSRKMVERKEDGSDDDQSEDQ